MLWSDDEDRSGIFRADGFNWRAEGAIEFTQSIDPLQGSWPEQRGRQGERERRSKISSLPDERNVELIHAVSPV